MIELKYTACVPEGTEAQVELYGRFVCEKECVNVKGFYAGNGIYMVRFLPKHSGSWQYKISGVVSDEGILEVSDDQCAVNMIRPEGTHFVYHDGTVYFPFGTTIYAMVHQTDELLEQTFQTLHEAPFNKVRLCVFPKHYQYNENEPEHFPFRKDMHGKFHPKQPDYEYWDRLECVINRLNEERIQADLILFHPYDCWGFSSMTMEENRIYLDYALRRLSAFENVWWSLANEYDLMFGRKEEEWHEIEQFVAENDPYHHLLSAHDFVKMYDFSRENITHCSIQSDDVFKTADLIHKYQKPVIFDEMKYEGNVSERWGNLPARELVNRFWKVYSVGGYATHGETFLSKDDVIWWAKGGTLKGQSPARIRFLREIIERIGVPLEPWEEVSIEEFLAQAENGEAMRALMDSADAEAQYLFGMNGTVFSGKHGSEVFVKYYGDQCPAQSAILLPEEGSYRLMCVDTWEMKTEILMENASGSVSLNLPGKEGIAVIARKVSR